MHAHVLPAASFVLVVAACGAHLETTPPDAMSIRVVSDFPATPVFGQRIPVSVLVSSSDGTPRKDVAVSFTAFGLGVVDPAYAHTDTRGIASAVWTLSESDRQTLTAQPNAEQPISIIVMPTNAWALTTNTNPRFTARFADDTLPGTSSTWASTALGSPPQLLVACEPSPDTSAGVVTLALTHPRLTPTRGAVTWTLDGREPVTEEWTVWQTRGLEYPWGDFNTRALVGWIATGKTFTVRFHDPAANVDYTARFESAGLGLAASVVTDPCSGPKGPWDY